MLKIGTFSKLSRLSIRMLRRYDELGLLQPVHTDPFTGYRYYREEQLTTAGRIAALRDMGCPPAGRCWRTADGRSWTAAWRSSSGRWRPSWRRRGSGCASWTRPVHS